MWPKATRISPNIYHFSCMNTILRTLILILVSLQCLSGSETCDNQDITSCGGENKEKLSQNMELVLYDEKFVSPFHKDKKELKFGAHKVVILQDWKNLGVAAVVWDAAVVLGEFLMEHKKTIENKRVLELGAGTGLVGIVAALIGGHVTTTDRLVALDIIEKNVAANRETLNLDKLTVAELDWGQNHSNFPTFDVVIGADIIYIEETFDALLETLDHVCDCKTAVFLSCKIRYDRDNRFLEKMKSLFNVTEVFYETHRDIHVYKCNKKC